MKREVGVEVVEIPAEQVQRRRLEILGRMRSQAVKNPELRARAARELDYRLMHWVGDALPHQSRFKDEIPRGRKRSVTIRADPIELLIIRAIAMTMSEGASQFGVSPNGAVFTADANGWTINRRIDVTGLSPLLDEAADVFNQVRGGTGGRFYERGDEFFNAEGKRTFIKVASTSAKADRVGRLWERVASSVVALTGGKSGVVPYSIPSPRSQIGRSGAKRDCHSVNRQPVLCPVHRIELPVDGRCDYCA